MSRKYPVVSKRKKDLNSKLRELKNEGDNVLKYVKNVIDEGTAIARDLETETDNVIFIQRYPVVIGKLNTLLNKLVHMNCSIELSASEDEGEESIQNYPYGTEPSLRSDYELLIPENRIECSAARNNPDIHKNSFSSEFTHSSTSKIVPLCPIQEGDILDMCYLDGDTPYNFWLRYYKTKSLDYLNETMLTRYHNKQLHPYGTSLQCNCRYVCAFDGEKCFRGEVLSIHLGQPVRFTMLDVDSGRMQTVEQVRVFRLDKDLSETPVQAINCCLHGDLGDPLSWNDQVIPLFHQVLAESELVVTVCGKIERDVPLYLVEIDCHNDERINSKIELNRWIILSVYPKLEEMKEKSKGDDILKSLYVYLDPVIRDKEESTEQVLHTRSSFLTDMSRPPNLLPNLTLPCPATFIRDQNQPHNIGQGESSSLNQMKKSSPWKHMELTPHHNLKAQTAASTENLNLCMNSKSELPELNLKSPSQTTLDEGERSNMNCLTHSSFSNMPASCSVSSGITTEPVSPLPEEKNISLHQSVLISSVGQTYKAMLAHIEDPGEFYIHILCEDNIEIDELQNEMNQYYNTVRVKFKSKKAAKYIIGSFCVAFYDADKHWYRAQIVDWNQDNDSDLVSIKYVDYGNHSSLHFSMLQPLRAEYTGLPVCARQCHLAMIHPHTSTQDKISKSWSRDAANEFKKLVNMESLYSVVLMEPSEDSVCSLPVLLQDCQNDICINKCMFELGYAVSFSPVDCSLFAAQRKEQEVSSASQDQNAQNLNADNDIHEDFSYTEELIPGLDIPYHMDNNIMHDWDPMSEDYFSESNTLHHDDEDACYAVTGYKPQDEKRICKFYAQKGRCFKGENCLKEHSYPHPDGWTTDKERKFQDAFSKLVLSNVPDEIMLQVTCITKVNMFYAVTCDECPSSSDKVHIRRIDVEGEEDEEETLVTLNNYLNEEHNVKTLRRCAVTPAFGQIVVARFSVDGRFYRARVMDYSDGKFYVFYVDYGNREWVSKSDVRDIEPKYLHLPFQAIDCVLANVENVTESFEAKKFFASLVYNKTFHARVIARLCHLSRLEVLLWDENGYDVGARIIQSNYGKERIYSAHGLVAQGN
jgi:hypothetical protein